MLSHFWNEPIKDGFHFVKLADEKFVVKRKTGFYPALPPAGKRNGAVAC